MNIRLIIFDFDGTLGDTRHNIVLTMQQTMVELHLPVADEAACAATIGLSPVCIGSFNPAYFQSTYFPARLFLCAVPVGKLAGGTTSANTDTASATCGKE